MKRLDGELFWMLFAFFAILIILYMGYTLKSNVDENLNSLNYTYCLKMVYGIKTEYFDAHGSYILNNTTIIPLNLTD